MSNKAEAAAPTTQERKETSASAGTGAYYRDKRNNDFCWRLRVGPRGAQKTIGFARAKTAAKLKIAVRAELGRIAEEGETKKVVDNSTISHSIDVWFSTKIIPRRKSKTCDSYRVQIPHVKAAVGGRKARAAGVSEAEAIVKYYQSIGLGDWSALKGLQIFCGALKLRMADLKDNGFDPPEEPEARDRVLSEDEFRDFLAELFTERKMRTRRGEVKTWPGYRDRYLIALALNTGLRISEALGIVTMTLSLKTGILNVEHQLEWTKDKETGKSVYLPSGDRAWELVPTKGEDKRKVPLNDEAIKHIKGQIAMIQTEEEEAGPFYQANGLLFCTNRGKPHSSRNVLRTLVTVQERINVRRKEAELPAYEHWTIHDLRRTYATYLAAVEDKIHLVADILGHKRIETTRKCYVHAQEAGLREAGAKVSFGKEKAS